MSQKRVELSSCQPDAKCLHISQKLDSHLVEQRGEIPPPIQGHTCVFVAGKNSFIVLGGFIGGNSLNPSVYEFNLASSSWRQLSVSGSQPCAREGHTAVANDKSMYIFGGSENNNRRRNDVYEFRFSKSKWHLLETTGSVPAPRSCASGVLYGDLFIIYGGWNGHGHDVFNDVHALNVRTNVWQKWVCIGDTPDARSHHTAVLYEGRMYIFGGYHSQTATRYNDIYAMDIQNHAWKKIIPKGGLIPPPRSEHTAVVYNDSMYIYGGYSGNAQFNDLYSFDFLKGRWKQYAFSNRPPTKRFRHTAVVCPKGEMYIFGGAASKSPSETASRNRDLYRISFGKRKLGFLKSFQQAGKYADIVCIAEDDVQILAHKCILSQSKVLSNMIQQLTDEDVITINTEKKETIHCLDIQFDEQVFTQILNFLYSATVEYEKLIQDWQLFIRLTKAAQFYELDILVNNLYFRFRDILTPSNVIPIYTKTSQMGLKLYSNFCLDFMKMEKKQIEKLLNEDIKKILNSHTVESIHIDFIEGMNHLYKHISYLYESKIYTDWVLVAGKDGTKFNVHKVIVCNNEFLENMASNRFLESSQDVVKLENMSGPILDMILKNIYTGEFEIPNNVENLMDLVQNADLFLLTEYRNEAMLKLLMLINETNALTIADFCRKHFAEAVPQLVNECFEKVKKIMLEVQLEQNRLLNLYQNQIKEQAKEIEKLKKEREKDRKLVSELIKLYHQNTREIEELKQKLSSK